jgi:hypothetical protein
MGEGAIKLPANPILTGGLGWAVVEDAYVRLKDKPVESARDLDHLRRGGVLRLDERQFGLPEPLSRQSFSGDDRAPQVWYRVDSDGAKGWVLGSELDIYSSREQAEKAAEFYR